jgi:hypothetical protein
VNPWAYLSALAERARREWVDAQAVVTPAAMVAAMVLLILFLVALAGVR